jgi:hypothetical protein
MRIDEIVDRTLNTASEAEQLATVKTHMYAIRYIKNPSEAVQLAAVRVDGDCIRYIKNPTEAVQLVAVNQDGELLDAITNPSKRVIITAALQMLKDGLDDYVIHCHTNDYQNANPDWPEWVIIDRARNAGM